MLIGSCASYYASDQAQCSLTLTAYIHRSIKTHRTSFRKNASLMITNPETMNSGFELRRWISFILGKAGRGIGIFREIKEWFKMPHDLMIYVLLDNNT